MSAAIDVVQAIISRWDAQDLDDVFAGGIWFDEAPPEVVWDYVTVSTPDDSIAGASSSNEFFGQLIAFDVWVKEDGATDPLLLLKSRANSLLAAMKHAPLAISASAGKVLNFRSAGGDLYLKDPATERVWHAVLNLRALRSEPANYSPG